MKFMQMLSEIDKNIYHELNSDSLLGGSFFISKNENMFLAIENEFKSVIPSEWNRFAQQCNGSARVSYERISNLGFKNLGRHRLRLFDIFKHESGENIKIGQCALTTNKAGRGVFVDRLQLLPGHDHHWKDAMKAILSVAGVHSFEYGWQLNFEAPRERDLASIGGVTVQTVRSLVVHAVDFQRWKSWDDYFRSMSENSRRNAKAAQRDLPDMRLLERFGHRSFLSIPALVWIRATMGQRKGLELKVARSAFSYMSWIALCPDYVVTSLAVNGRKVLCTYFGVEFGNNTYYLEGASRAGVGGASWRLLISMLKRAYDRHPNGKFVMGYVDTANVKDPGLVRSREACRVSDYPTSIVCFSYDPAAVA